MKFDGGHFAEHGKLYYCTAQEFVPAGPCRQRARAQTYPARPSERDAHARHRKLAICTPSAPRARHGTLTSRLRRYALIAAFCRLHCFQAGVFAQDQLPVVTAAKPVVRDIVEDDEFVGRFEAVDQVAIRSRVAGYLDTVHFKDGALVKKDDLLFTIDQRPYQAAYDAAKSQIDVWNSLLEFSKAQLERAEELAKTGNIAASIVDDRRREFLSNQAQIQGATAALRTASLNLEFTEIRAPLVRPHRPPPRVGRQSGPAGFHLADDDRHARPDRLLFRHR